MPSKSSPSRTSRSLMMATGLPFWRLIALSCSSGRAEGRGVSRRVRGVRRARPAWPMRRMPRPRGLRSAGPRCAGSRGRGPWLRTGRGRTRSPRPPEGREDEPELRLPPAARAGRRSRARASPREPPPRGPGRAHRPHQRGRFPPWAQGTWAMTTKPRSGASFSRSSFRSASRIRLTRLVLRLGGAAGRSPRHRAP